MAIFAQVDGKVKAKANSDDLRLIWPKSSTPFIYSTNVFPTTRLFWNL
jgi:hypothetical protein